MGAFPLYILFFFSGAAGLVYELVWVRELIFVFGGTTYAITTVLVAFMAGLGLGSYLAGQACRRLHQPQRTYGLLEIGIGLYALAVPLLLGVAQPAYRALYPHMAQTPWLLTMARFVLSGLVLLVPTTCMGATLPILVRYVTLRGCGLGRSVGYLYGINTLGAVLGTLAAGFWLIPTLGLLRTTWLAAAVNLAIGMAARGLLRPAGEARVVAQAARRIPVPGGGPAAVPMTTAVRRVVLVGFAASGFAAMVYQIMWTRALIMSVGSSTYSFTCILAAFILGLAAGSLALARWADRWPNPARVFGLMELMIGLIAVLIVPSYGRLPLLVKALVASYHTQYGALLTWQFLLIIAITFVPTFLMGAIFPLVTRALAAAGEEAGAATGRAYAINTVGTILGSFLAGFVLIRSDVLGVQRSINAASVLNGLVGAALLLLAYPTLGAPARRRVWLPAGGLVLILLMAVLAGQWDRSLITSHPYLARDVPAAREVVYLKDGVDLTVGVEHPSGSPESLTLTVNGKPDASLATGDMLTQLLLGHLPALLNTDGRAACVIGLGSGMTLSAFSRHPSYERLDCVEISAEVIEAAGFFAPYTYNVLTSDPRVRMIRADGRNHLLLTDQTYDLIVSEPSNPWISGVANLFTREFFELGRNRLTNRGLLAVWLHGYSISVRDFEMVVHTLFDVFEHVSIWQLSEPDFLLIGSRQPLRIPWEGFLQRFEVPAVRADLYRVGLHRPAHILGRYIAGDGPLRAWAAGAPVHTDDNALLEFSAPRHLYSDEGRELAEALLALQRPVLEDLAITDGAPLPETLAGEVAGVVAGRLARIRGDEALRRNDPAGALRVVVDGYLGDRSNAELYTSVREAAGLVRTKWRQRAAEPGVMAQLARVQRLQPPLFISRRGATLAEIARQLQTSASRLTDEEEWGVAADYLLQAWRLVPTDRGTALALAWVLAEGGRGMEAAAIVDQLEPQPNDGLASYVRAILAVQAGDLEAGLSLLEATVRSGAVPPNNLATDKALAPLRNDPRFRTLLGGSPTSQPEPPPP